MYNTFGKNINSFPNLLAYQMEKAYTEPQRAIRTETLEKHDFSHNQKSGRRLPKFQTEQYDESSRIIWAENPDGYLINMIC